MLSIIVAVAENNAIGKDNGLLWRLPNDLKYFKEKTNGKTIIMGRNTFESLPKVLPNRDHVVLTTDMSYSCENTSVSIIHSIQDIENLIEDEKEHFVIGGGEIYRMFLPYCSRVYITKVHQSFEADTFFPAISSDEWGLESSSAGVLDEKNTIDHEFLVYCRK